MLDTSPIIQKVAAKLASSPSRTINVNVLHRRLGHLGIDNCRVMVNHRLVDGVDKIVGKEEFCEGCAYGQSKCKHHPITSTKTRRQLERIHIDLCGPLPNSIGGNRYGVKSTRFQWSDLAQQRYSIGTIPCPWTWVLTCWETW